MEPREKRSTVERAEQCKGRPEGVDGADSGKGSIKAPSLAARQMGMGKEVCLRRTIWEED